MVDPQALHVAALDQIEHQPMRLLEQLGQFHAQAGELIYIEESPVIDLFGSDPPISNPICLNFEQLMQPLEARRVAGLTGELSQCALDAACKTRFTSAFDEPLLQFSGALARTIRPEFVKGTKLAGQRCQRLTASFEDNRIAARRDRETMLEIPRTEVPRLGIKAENNLSFLKDEPIVIGQYRQQDPVLEIWADAVPIDVEISGKRRLSAPFENIAPPAVVAADAHMVWDKIEDQPHAVRMQRVEKRAEVGLRADFRIEPVVIDDVVAVRRARTRLHDRRSVDMADAQRREVRHQLRRIGEGEPAMELQSISGPDRSEAVGQPAHSVDLRRRASAISAATRPSSVPGPISSKVLDKRRRQFGC